jgi:hypothetical protein
MMPIARFLLRNGVGYREFSEISKLAFVQVASDEYGIRGRKTNMSRVAVMTGLTRKEVRRVRERLLQVSSEQLNTVSKPEQLLQLWAASSRYRTRLGRPKGIRFGDESDPESAATFLNLVKAVGGDIPPGALLKELIRAGSVRDTGDKLQLISSSFLPKPSDPEALRIWGTVLSDLASTIDYNHTCENPSDRLLERQIYFEDLPDDLAEEFQSLAQERGKSLLHELDGWVSMHQLDAPASAPRRTSARRVGLGVYVVNGVADGKLAPKT